MAQWNTRKWHGTVASVAQWHSNTLAHRTVAQWHSGTLANGTVAWHSGKVAQWHTLKWHSGTKHTAWHSGTVTRVRSQGVSVWVSGGWEANDGASSVEPVLSQSTHLTQLAPVFGTCWFSQNRVVIMNPHELEHLLGTWG